MDNATALALGMRTWHARRGEQTVEMTWAEMTPVHLRNAAAFLRRKYAEAITAGYAMHSMVNGEMALDQIESQLRQLEDEGEDVQLYADEMERYAAYKEGHIDQLKRTFGHDHQRSRHRDS